MNNDSLNAQSRSVPSQRIAAALPVPPRRRVLIGAMLLTALLCNTAVLFVPFMDLRRGLISEPYSLLRSVEMLWGEGLYVLALLVVGFSVVFPFAKLGVLSWFCAKGGVQANQMSVLGWVERLGKWSMLDVFLVCIILTLTSDQLLVGTEPMIGIPLFIAAITLSMLAGELIARAVHQETMANPEPVQRRRRSAGVWVLLSGLALAGAIGLPFLRISDWLLTDNSYSVVTLVPSLWSAGAKIPAVVTAFFLVILPIARWLTAVASWRRLRKKHALGPLRERLSRLGRWSMLDVFGFALAVFLVEGEYLMRTEVRWGSLFLVAFVALDWVFEFVLERIFDEAS